MRSYAQETLSYMETIPYQRLWSAAEEGVIKLVWKRDRRHRSFSFILFVHLSNFDGYLRCFDQNIPLSCRTMWVLRSSWVSVNPFFCCAFSLLAPTLLWSLEWRQNPRWVFGDSVSASSESVPRIFSGDRLEWLLCVGRRSLDVYLEWRDRYFAKKKDFLHYKITVAPVVRTTQKPVEGAGIFRKNKTSRNWRFVRSVLPVRPGQEIRHAGWLGFHGVVGGRGHHSRHVGSDGRCGAGGCESQSSESLLLLSFQCLSRMNGMALKCSESHFYFINIVGGEKQLLSISSVPSDLAADF